MAKRIEGRVALILNQQEVTINRGLEEGVVVGMRFAVLADTPLEVKDPESQELLGTMDREKIRVEAVDVSGRFSICRTYETYTVGGLGLGTTIADMFGETRRETRTFKVKDPGYIPPLPEEESYVKVGDRVRQLTEREEDED